MGMKFLNKKGWHTGSLRNIENVWKAEQKHEAEQKKLEELRKQIHEERERADFRQLQVEAGLIPRQERLDFLYESGLAVGKGSSSFQELDSLPKTAPETGVSSSVQAPSAEKEQGLPGALFGDKPQSANDAWRKLHSDPLLLIRQREQEALARVKNNPVQMAMIRKSVESKQEKHKKKHSTKKHKKKSKHRYHSSSENDSDSEGTALTAEKEKDSRQSSSRSDKHSHKEFKSSDEEPSNVYAQRKKYDDKEYRDQRRNDLRNPKYEESDNDRLSRKSRNDSKTREYYSERDRKSHKRSHISSSDKPPRNEPDNRHQNPVKHSEKESDFRNPKYEESDDNRLSRKNHYDSKNREYSSDKRNHISSYDKPPRSEAPNNMHRNPVKLSEEERASRLREMQMDAEKHEEQRWKRIKKANDTDAQEAVHDKASLGRNFLDAAQKSVYGAENGGSTTIEESVRRRTHYLQGKSATDSNAFRR